jgi:hypothetical protein
LLHAFINKGELLMTEITKPQDYYTIKQIVKEMPFMTESGWRFQIFHEETNGFKEFGVVKRIGSKILIDYKAFVAWLEATNQSQKRKGAA